MSINDFIMAVLNITSDMILNVFAEIKNGVFRIYIKLKEGNKRCPTCNDDYKIKVNCYKDRTIKHSVFNNKDCVIIYRQRRYFCPRCESTFAESNPFGIKGENLSHLTKVNILEDLKFEGNTYSMVAKRIIYSINKTYSLK